MVKTQALDVSKFTGKEGDKVVIKKLSFGEEADIRDSIPVQVMGTVQNAKPLLGQLGITYLMKSVISAPFMKGQVPTLEEIRNIDADLGDFILEKVYELNQVSPN